MIGKPNQKNKQHEGYYGYDNREHILGVRSEGVRSEELGVRSEEWGVRSEELGVYATKIVSSSYYIMSAARCQACQLPSTDCRDLNPQLF